LNLGFFSSSKVDKSNFAAVLLLNLGALSWFFIFNSYMEDIFVTTNLNTTEWAAFVGNSLVYGFAIFWSIAISFVGSRINRRKLLFTSIILGIFSTVLLAFVEGPFLTSILASLMGMSLGMGLPSSMALVADNTAVENRGRASGIIILGTFIIAFASMAICRMMNLDLFDLILILAAVRSISLFALVIGNIGRPLTIGEQKIRLPPTAYREFLFYLCPLAMFTIASSLAKSLITAASFESALYLGENLRYIFIAAFGLAAGFIADRFGRKQPIIFGLATLGIGYLLLGFNMSEMSVIIYSAFSGITWGLFFVVFLAVPGDLSTPILREKFYALGYILPVTALFALSAIPVENIGDILPPEIIAQILGICLFLAMYPVFRAKETLTESKRQEGKMKEYVERVGKAIHETDENE
jgi:MFS family permease